MIDEEHLKLGKNAYGDEVWICGHCGKTADDALSAEHKNQLLYLLMCPAGKVTLGEWLTEEDKKAELTAFADKLKGRK